MVHSSWACQSDVVALIVVTTVFFCVNCNCRLMCCSLLETLRICVGDYCELFSPSPSFCSTRNELRNHNFLRSVIYLARRADRLLQLGLRCSALAARLCSVLSARYKILQHLLTVARVQSTNSFSQTKHVHLVLIHTGMFGLSLSS